MNCMHARARSLAPVGFASVLFLCSILAKAQTNELDRRVAKIVDSSGSETQVSGLTVEVGDHLGRFRLDDLGYDQRKNHLALATKDIEFAISLRAVVSIEATGGKKWTVKYQSRKGEVSVLGDLAPATLNGKSDFGPFSLSVLRLTRLVFLEPGVASGPNVTGKQEFGAVLTLADGVTYQALEVRRYANYVTGYSRNTIPATYGSSVQNDHLTDFRFTRGDTAQTIPFENIKAVDFALSERAVTVTAKSGARAEMKLPHLPNDHVEDPTAFTGFSGFLLDRGYFYIPLQFVKSITFGPDAGAK